MAPLGDISLGTFADFGFVVPRIVVQVYAGYTLTNQYTVLWKLEEKLEFKKLLLKTLSISKLKGKTDIGHFAF